MARCWRSTWFATAAEAYNAVDETRSRQRRLDLDQSQSGCGVNAAAYQLLKPPPTMSPRHDLIMMHKIVTSRR
jgi:hypothetical protein